MLLSEFIKNMVGRIYHYRGVDHRVQNAYLSSEGVAVITTDIEFFKIEDATIETLENQFVPIVKSNNGIVKHQEFTSLIKAEQPKLIGVLMEDLDKIKKDPGYIPQATARRNIVESVIKISRLELDVHKATNATVRK